MKSFDSPRPWPPEACGELRQHLSRYGWARKPKPAVDDLFAILDELDEWLHDARRYKNQRRRDEWASITEDVRIATEHMGPLLRLIVPSANSLALSLDDRLGVDQNRRAAIIPLLEQVRAELRAPGSPGAAFVDLFDTVKDTTTRTAVINGRVDLLDAVLRFVDRSLGGVSEILSGILDNDGWSVHLALHYLEGKELGHPLDADEDAGLSEDQRINLGRRWVEHQPEPAHHIVWLFYGHARADWRFTVGRCEFFNGPTLVSALAEVDKARQAGGTYPDGRSQHSTPPEELIADDVGGPYLRKRRAWPADEHWVGVRVDLGTSIYPDVVQTARDQVRALIALAAFDCGQTSWTELSGYKQFADGHQAGSSRPFEEVGAERKWAQADHTGDWLHDHQAELGNHLATGSEAHAVVTAATAFADMTTATPAIALLEAVRVIETQASVFGIHWKELVHEYVTPASSLSRARTSAFNVLTAIAGDHELCKHIPHLRDLPTQFRSYESGQYRINLSGAVDRLPALVAEVPAYNRHSRQLRHTAEDLATPAAIAAFVAEETRTQQRLVRRVHRVRNSLTHGGPIEHGIVASANAFIARKAKHITDVTLRALLDGQPPTETLRKYRQDNIRWTTDLASMPTVEATLFPGAIGEER